MNKFLLRSVNYLNGVIHYSLDMYSYDLGRCTEQEIDFYVESETGKADIRHLVKFIEKYIKSSNYYIDPRSEDLIKNFNSNI